MNKKYKKKAKKAKKAKGFSKDVNYRIFGCQGIRTQHCSTQKAYDAFLEYCKRNRYEILKKKVRK